MARLPDPVTSGMELIYPKDYLDKQKELYRWIAQAIRKAEADKKKQSKRKSETD